jgi:hypothetical protein
MAEINQIAASSGDDPKLDTLLRLHSETDCRRVSALACIRSGCLRLAADQVGSV